LNCYVDSLHCRPHFIKGKGLELTVTGGGSIGECGFGYSYRRLCLLVT